MRDILGPLRIPGHPFLLSRFGLFALRSAKGLINSRFRTPKARALFAGMAGHSMLPLDKSPTASFALVEMILAHSVGWPLAKGGSQSIANALAGYLTDLGGTIETGREILSFGDLPSAKVVLFDLTPRQILALEGLPISGAVRSQLDRYRYGQGVFKIDWALEAPIPWSAAECWQSATVHVGGTAEEIIRCEQQVWDGAHPDRPFVLLAQQSQFDPSRAPGGMQTAWAYCHVPSGSGVDMTERIEAQVERFAPGFRQLIRARSTRNAVEMQVHNPNYVGGDINGGVQDLRQLFTRPLPRLNPYTLGDPRFYICSSSTPPGGGVHGMCGYFAARAALKNGLVNPR